MKELLARNWETCGINPGDTVLIHSSLKRTLIVYKTTPEEVLDSFLEAVGKNGTVIFPIFNFDFTKGVPFDIRSTPSQMGILTEAARNYPGAVRNGHPIYSFAAIGRASEKFNVDNFSGYGKDSPFGILRELDGKIAVLDLDDLNSMTFYHHIEEMNQVDYRFHKRFTAPYTGWDGETQERTYGLFVRKIDKGVITDVNPMGEILWRKGLYNGHLPKQETGLRTINANAMFGEVSNVIKSGKAQGLLYSVKENT